MSAENISSSIFSSPWVPSCSPLHKEPLLQSSSVRGPPPTDPFSFVQTCHPTQAFGVCACC